VPQHLDDAVLAQARAALEVDQSGDELTQLRNRRRRLLRWAVPTTLAACSLLVVSIVIRSGNEHQVLAPQASMDAAAPPAAAAPSFAQPAQPASQTDAEGLVLIAPPRNAVTEFSALAPAPSAESDAAQSERHREARQLAQRRSITQQVREELPQAFAGATGTDAMPAVPEREASAAALPAVADQYLARKAEAPASPSAAPVEVGSAAATTLETAAAPAMPVKTDAARAAAEGALEAKLSSREHAPEPWLALIRELRRKGMTSDADREWKSFRAQYPEYAVAPGDLARGDDHR
jgi:hypothetical protein